MRDDSGIEAEINKLRDEAAPQLSYDAPLNSAREMARRIFSHQDGSTLHHQQDTFYYWRGSHYTEAEREGIRAAIYNFLDGAVRMVKDKPEPFNPDKSKVANVLEALAAVTQLPRNAIAPA